MTKNIGKWIVPTMLFAPVLASAQELGWFKNVVTTFGSLVDMLVGIVITLAFVVFVWGLITFLVNSGDEEAKQEGKRRMIWGVIALFVIVSIWGIISLLQTFTDTGGGTTKYPDWKSTT